MWYIVFNLRLGCSNTIFGGYDKNYMFYKIKYIYSPPIIRAPVI
jgi:hypothetical protein